MNLHWPDTLEAPPLVVGEVHVWAVPLVGTQTPPAELESMLSAKDRDRAKRFLREEAGRSFATARAGLRTILGRYLRLPPIEVPIDTAPNGKPHLAASVASDLQFNLAHSGELALVAVTSSGEIGVDVERLRPVDHWPEISSRYFHAEEAAIIGDAAHTPANFFRCWTRKEAVLKAIGVGIIFPLDLFRVPLDKTTRDWVDVPAHSSNAAARYWLESLVPADGYLAAFAATRQPASVTGFACRI